MVAAENVVSVIDFLGKIKEAAAGSTHGSFTVFRGEKDAAWSLVPGIARQPFHPSDIVRDPDDPADRSAERRLLIVFRDHAPPYLPEWVWTGDEVEVRWKQLVVAQHYRLPTRFMDWTSNPLVALFFACEGAAERCPHNGDCEYRDANNEHCSRVCYFREQETASIASVAKKNRKPPLCAGPSGADLPLFVRPPNIDGRISAQSSFFSISENPLKPLRPHGEIRIAARSRADIVKDLDVMGINRKNLFPDLEGLAQYLKWGAHDWK
jgi:FRG domain